VNESFEDRLDIEIDALLGAQHGLRALQMARLEASSLPGQASKPDSVAVTDKPVAELAQFAAELRGKLPVARPSEAATRRGRERLLAELDALQRPRGFDISSFYFAWTWTLKRLLASANLARRIAVVVTLLVAALAFNGALAASANSLPGDPLYDLKRIQEQVRLTITMDLDAREKLQEQFDDKRITELNALRLLLRVMRTEVSGTVSAIEGDTLVVDQVPFAVDRAQFPAVTDVVVGDRVRLVVQTNSDGSVAVVEFTREPSGKPGNDALGGSPAQSNSAAGTPRPAGARSATPPAQSAASATPGPGAGQPATRIDPVSTPTPQPSPTREDPKQATSTPTGTLSGTPTPSELHHVPTPTFRPETTYTPAPTDGPDTTHTPAPTDRPDATYTPRPTHTLEATESPEPTETRRPTPTPTASRTPRPTETRTVNPSPTQTLTLTATPEH
jgi:hypothetical protein